MRAQDAGDVSAQGMLTILLIDDDAISREVQAVLLAPLGVTVETAEDGELALARLEARAGLSATSVPDASVPDAILPDAILLDAQLPGLRGTELIRALRQRSAAPILVFSASAVDAELEAAADGCVQKPAEPETILDAVRRAIQQANFGAMAAKAELPLPMRQGLDGLDGLDEPDALPVIDPAVLAKFRMPQAALRSMYAALVEDGDRRLPVLRAALEAGDAEAAHATAHAIKGGCAMLGVTRMRDAAAALEVWAAAEDWRSDFSAMEAALEALRSRVQDASFDFATTSI